MADTIKMTKIDCFKQLAGIVEASDVENKEDILKFIQSSIETLENRKRAAQERAEKKKNEPDELADAIKAVLSEELQTADDIAAQIEGEDVTKQKVVARLTKMVNAGIVRKDSVKTDDKRKVMGYALV